MKRIGIVLTLVVTFGLWGGTTASLEVVDGRTAPLFDDLGSYHHPISTSTKLAQRYFDQGLTLAYAFNHAEAIRSFREAARLDPECAMCYWGASLALGPNINAPMADDAVPEAHEALQKALGLASKVSEKEQAYIQALSKRYSAEPVEDRRPLDVAYANAMREVSGHYPDDLDAATLFAEALMDTMPWNYWTEDGKPKPETSEVIATLESVLARNPNHLGAIHYYIHTVEASANPERAEPGADRLGDLVPGAGHLVHMPSHIYLRVGRYHEASTANERAAAADESYIAQCNAQGFYPALYYPHNLHFLWFTSSMEGRSATSIDVARKLIKKVPKEQIGASPALERFLPISLFSLVHFGKWDEILREPQPTAEFRYETAMWHYARGLALAAKGRLDAAAGEATKLDKIAKSEEVKSLERPFFPGASMIEIANKILAGEIAGREGNKDERIRLFEAASQVQDGLPYMEPPYWYFPVRHFLGAALLEADRPAEAEAVYRQDLEKTPHNGWSLFGLMQSLHAQGKTDEAEQVQKRYEEAWAHADVKLAASRF